MSLWSNKNTCFYNNVPDFQCWQYLWFVFNRHFCLETQLGVSTQCGLAFAFPHEAEMQCLSHTSLPTLDLLPGPSTITHFALWLPQMILTNRSWGKVSSWYCSSSDSKLDQMFVSTVTCSWRYRMSLVWSSLDYSNTHKQLCQTQNRLSTAHFTHIVTAIDIGMQSDSAALCKSRFTSAFSTSKFYLAEETGLCL